MAQDDENVPLCDEALRQGAAVRLVGQLDLADELAGRCELLAATGKGDRTKAIFAGARLMTASAQAARALALLANVETRRRSIVETVQRPDPKIAELNAQNENRRIGEEEMLRVYRRMNEIVEDSVQARLKSDGGADTLAWLIRRQERVVAQILGIDPDDLDDETDEKTGEDAAAG